MSQKQQKISIFWMFCQTITVVLYWKISYCLLVPLILGCDAWKWMWERLGERVILDWGYKIEKSDRVDSIMDVFLFGCTIQEVGMKVYCKTLISFCRRRWGSQIVSFISCFMQFHAAFCYIGYFCLWRILLTITFGIDNESEDMTGALNLKRINFMKDLRHFWLWYIRI